MQFELSRKKKKPSVSNEEGHLILDGKKELRTSQILWKPRPTMKMEKNGNEDFDAMIRTFNKNILGVKKNEHKIWRQAEDCEKRDQQWIWKKKKNIENE